MSIDDSVGAVPGWCKLVQRFRPLAAALLALFVARAELVLPVLVEARLPECKCKQRQQLEANTTSTTSAPPASPQPTPSPASAATAVPVVAADEPDTPIAPAYEDANPLDTCAWYTFRPDGTPARPLIKLQPPGKGERGPQACKKPQYEEKSNEAMLFVYTCLEHGTVLGFHITDHEGRRDILGPLLKFGDDAPDNVVFDFACQ